MVRTLLAASLLSLSDTALGQVEDGQFTVRLQTVASGLTAPVQAKAPPDGTDRLFIVDQTGTIRIFENGALLPTPFLNVAALLAPLAFADDAKDKAKAPVGTWKKADGELVLEFVDKETLKIQPHGAKADITIECSYSVGKDGVLKVKITGHEAKDEIKKKLKEVAPVGTDLSFKWTADGNTASLDDLEGKNADGLKSHLEGKFEKK